MKSLLWFLGGAIAFPLAVYLLVKLCSALMPEMMFLAVMCAIGGGFGVAIKGLWRQ